MQNMLYSTYQALNPEQFNNDLIYIREKENINAYFEDLFSTLNAIPGIKFISMKRINEEDCGKYIQKENISIEESRLDLIEAKFKITWNGEEKEKLLYLFIPKLINNFFFVLNGNNYYAILQIADKNFYNVRNGVFLKTLLMPLGVRHKNATVETVYGAHYTGKVMLLDFFKTKGSNNINNFKNFFIYYFIKYGFFKTLEMFDLTDDKLMIVETSEFDPEESDDYECFEVNHLYIIANKELLASDSTFRNLTISIINALDNLKRNSNIDSTDFWKRKILPNATAKLERADKAIAAIERILDERTKKNLREIPSDKKESTFDVIVYMINNYEELLKLNSLNLYTRRIRLFE